MRATPNSKPSPGNAKYYLAHSGSGNLPALLVASAALDELRYASIEASQVLPTRGLEVGGLLLGRTAWMPTGARAAYIDQFQTLDIEHASGPSFIVSENDLAEIRSAIENAKKEGREVLGWWRTDTRSDEFRFAAEDISLSSRLFGKESRLDLLLRSEPEEPLRALLRTEGETFAASSQEFPFERDRMKTAEAPAAVIADPPKAKETRWADSIPEDAGGDKAKPADSPASAVTPYPIAASAGTNQAPNPGRRSGNIQPAKVLVLSLLAVCGVMVAYLGFWALRSEPPTENAVVLEEADDNAAAPSTIALRATRDGDGLRLEWDATDPTVREATAATLLIRDGAEQSKVMLTAEDLASGTYTVIPRSNDLRIELQTTGSSNSGRAVVQVLLPTSPSEAIGPQPEEPAENPASVETAADENRKKPSPAKLAGAKPPAAKSRQPARTPAPVKPGQNSTESETLPWGEAVPQSGTPAEASGVASPGSGQSSQSVAEGNRPTALPTATPADVGPSCQSSVSLVAFYEPRSALGFLKAIPRAVGIGSKPEGDEEDFKAPKLAQTPCPDLKGRRFVQKPENVEFLVEVSPDGSVKTVKPTGETAGTLISDHVRQTLENWRFEPAMLKDKAVRSEVQVRMKLRYPAGVYGAEGQ